MSVCVACKSICPREARFCPHCGTAIPAERPRSKIEAGTELDIDGWAKAVVGDRIGEGGMGIVYSGWLYYNPQGPKAGNPAIPVAVKVLHPLLRGRERVRKLFRGEAAALERLTHPNIVRFHALTELHGQLALVIELVDGQPLSDVIDDAKRTAPRALPCLALMPAWHYFSQLLGALAAIHALGIIHRDVKPSNLLIRTDGVAKLTDFGIARVPHDEVRTTGGMAPGTGAYMAPEQVMGKKLDSRADLYSAAIVLYEMLSGITPFEAPDRNEVLVRTAQVDEPPLPITRRVPQAPPILDVLMARALAKDPVLRYGSAIELGEAFRQGLGLPVTPEWSAQQQFARQAGRISQSVRGSTDPMDDVESERLRTAMMAGYRS